MIGAAFLLFLHVCVNGQAEPFLNDDRLCEIGDIQIGGLFRLHNTDPYLDNATVTNLKCDHRYQDTVVLVEAMIFAIKKINEDPKILKGIRLGYNIQGTCDDSIENMFYALDAYTDIEYKIKYPEPPLYVKPLCDVGPAIAGLIGPASSEGTESVASLLRLFDIPVISYEATSPALGNHDRFPSLFRTIFADDKQAAALVDLVEHFDWNYIAVVGSDDTIGRRGIYEFKKLIWKRTNLCIAYEAYFGDDGKLESILKNLQLTSRVEGNITTNVTLLFMDWEHAVRLLKKAEDYELQNTTWIGVEQWTSNMSMTFSELPGFLPSKYTNGVISTEIPSDVPLQFLGWLTGYIELRIERNPWLFRYYCEQCSLIRKGHLPDNSDNCTTDFTLSEDCLNVVNMAWIVRKQRRVSNVISAVYALAFALEEVREQGGLTKAKDTFEIPYYSVVNALDHLNITTKIPVLCDDHPDLRFDENGNLENASYEIHNFYGTDPDQPAIDAPGPPDDDNGHGIGTWTEINHPDLQINASLIHWKTGQKPISHCFRHCVPGEQIVYSPTLCCWDCERCPGGTYSTISQSPNCTVCPANFHTNQQRNDCLPNTQIWISWNDALGISNTALCALGQTSVIISAIISFIYRNNKEFSDKYTMKSAVLINCALGFTYVIYHAFSPEILLCSVRRVAWQTGITAHCVAAFFQIYWGWAQSLKLRALRIPERFCPHVAYGFFTLTGFFAYLLIVFVHPPSVDMTDLGKITGQYDKTYVDCGEDIHGPFVIGFSVVYPGIFGLTAVLIAFREVQYQKRSSLIATLKTLRPTTDYMVRTDYRAVRSLLYSAYVCVLVVGALAPIYFTLEDPWNRSFLLLIGAFISNSAILGIYLIPRVKNVIFKRNNPVPRRNSLLGEIIVTTANLTATLARTADKRKTPKQ